MQGLRHENASAGNGGRKPTSSSKFAAGAIGVSALAVGALLMFQKCSGPEVEPIVKEKQTTVEVCPAPYHGDGKCEINKGEHDTISRFAPEDCGTCGDGKQQAHETALNCPVDFHCGNGEVDQGKTYPAMVKVTDQSGVYVWGLVTITESCDKADTNYCEADCPKEEAKAEAGHRRERREKPPVEAPVQGCTPAQCDTSRVKPGPLIGRLLRSVDASQLRKDLGCSDDIGLSAKFSVSPEGVPSQQGAISATCGGKTTALDSKANLSNVKVGAPGGECRCILPTSAEIPKEGSSG
ncbi:MAG: hypothetical protein PHF60_00220 [Candidatus ainarchaeum sp.]|nr:hypothetical protein [Candidatus ainarchaeum sp.]